MTAPEQAVIDAIRIWMKHLINQPLGVYANGTRNEIDQAIVLAMRELDRLQPPA